MAGIEQETISFIDRNSNDNGIVIVRVLDSTIALSLSLEHDGDIEVFFTPEVCSTLISALQSALIRTEK